MNTSPRETKITGQLLVFGGPYSNLEATAAILKEASPGHRTRKYYLHRRSRSLLRRTSRRYRPVTRFGYPDNHGQLRGIAIRASSGLRLRICRG
jgi:hypothetical protein